MNLLRHPSTIDAIEKMGEAFKNIGAIFANWGKRLKTEPMKAEDEIDRLVDRLVERRLSAALAEVIAEVKAEAQAKQAKKD